MVELFFVLSGFVIALNYMDRVQDLRGIFAFQKRRFWRLYPLHIFTLLVFLAIECLKLIAQSYAHGDFGSAAFGDNNLVAFVNNLLLTQGVFLNRVSFNYPAWSISTEFYTYLLFALVMLAGQWRLACCAVIAFAGWGFLELYDPQWQQIDMRIFRCLYAFFLGVLGCAFVKRYNPTVPGVVPGLLLIGSIVAVTIFSAGRFHSAVPLLFLLTVCSFAGAGSDCLIVRALSLRPLVYLGTISYSLYMMHATVWWISNQVLRAGRRTSMSGARESWISARSQESLPR